MSRQRLEIEVEPRDDLYRGVLAAGLETCVQALLVVRHTIDLSEQAKQLLETLQPYVANVEEASEWPGTKLLDSHADLYHLRFDYACCEILKREADGLYDWLQPGLPEDLSLVRDDGTAWLRTISHERYAELLVDPSEVVVLNRFAPGLVLKAIPSLAT